VSSRRLSALLLAALAMPHTPAVGQDVAQRAALDRLRDSISLSHDTTGSLSLTFIE
jgi:hypothetical protein